MSKLTVENKFIDVSDYGRPIANIIAEQLKFTKVTAIHLTLLFGVSGLMAIYCIAAAYYWAAGFFLILKSILDADDGQLARVKNQPSFTGRYLDSIFDSILNLALLVHWLGYRHKSSPYINRLSLHADTGNIVQLLSCGFQAWDRWGNHQPDF